MFDSVGTFEEWLAALPPLTWIEVFRTYEMPTRGTIDDAFIQHVDLIVPGSADYIVADMSTTGDLRGTDDRAELLEYLEDWRGRLVAVGIWPPRSGKEEDVLDIVIPNHDGTIVPGVY